MRNPTRLQKIFSLLCVFALLFSSLPRSYAEEAGLISAQPASEALTGQGETQAEPTAVPQQEGTAAQQPTGKSAVFGVAILRNPSEAQPTETPEALPEATQEPAREEAGTQVDIQLDFHDYTPAADAQNALVQYDAERECVFVSLERVLGQDRLGSVKASVKQDAEGAAAIVPEALLAKETADSAPVRYEKGRLVLTGDGQIDLTDGKNAVHVAVEGYDALLSHTLRAADVTIEVLDGFVPAGASPQFSLLGGEDAAQLAERYLNPAPLPSNPAPASVKKSAATARTAAAAASAQATAKAATDAETARTGSQTGYAAFDLSIQSGQKEWGEQGSYRVLMPLSVSVDALLPENARQTNVTYRLYHVHGEQIDSLDFTYENGMLSFTTPNFSSFIFSYTVDFEYIDPETGEVKTFNLEGSGEMLLSELMRLLEIEGDLTGSAAVFSDPLLLAVTPVLSEDQTVADWLLTSLEPFDVEETLTVTLQSGRVIVIKVTDDQIVAHVIDAAGDTYAVTVTYEKDALIPENAELRVREITQADAGYEAYLARVPSALGERVRVLDAKLFDISIWADGQKITPAAPVEVHIEFIPMDRESGLSQALLHYSDGASVPDVVSASSFGGSETELSSVTFEADSFSVFLVASTVLEKTLTASDGSVYRITATYDSRCGIPADAELTVSEILPGTAQYDSYLARSAQAVGRKAESVDFAHAFDISLLDQSTGKHIQPTKDVTVSIELLQEALSADADVNVVHFGNEAELMSSSVDGGTVVFAANGFSVYVVISTNLTETVQASDGNTYEINVTYKNTAGIPMEGTALMVSELLPGDAGYDAYVAASAEKVGVNAESFALSRVFDIKIVDAEDRGIVYEPAGDVEVSIRLVGEALNQYANVEVLHFVQGESKDGFTVYDMNSTVNGETVQFTTNSFSVYVVTGSVHVRTYYFYTFDEYLDYVPYYLNTDVGTEDSQTYIQIVREGETPVVPQNPVNPQDQEAAFAGWYQGTANTANGPTASTPYTFGPVSNLNEDESVYLYAVFSHYTYVIFHDQYDRSSDSFPVAFSRRLDLSSEQESDWYVDVNQFSVSYEDPEEEDDTKMVFVGWSDTPITVPGASLNDDGDTVAKVQTSNGRLYATETTHLYPIYQPVQWISFYSGPTGSRATYYPDTYYLDGVGPTALHGSDTTTREGSFDFAGWYLHASLDNDGETVIGGANCVKAANADGSLNTDATDDEIAILAAAGITFVNTAEEGEEPAYRLQLTQNITLYAYWITNSTANYTVIIEKQNATDADDADVSNNTYSYTESFTLSGPIGSTVQASSLSDYVSLNTAAGYNAAHGTEIADEDNDQLNPYANYAFSAERSDGSAVIESDGSGVLYLRYNWITQPEVSEKYTLRFVDPMADPEYVIMQYAEEEIDGELIDSRIARNAPLAGKAPSAAPVSTVSPEGLTFAYWYADRACTTRAFFDQESYDAFMGTAGHGAAVLFSVMPAEDLTIYAGWTREWFLIKIDPNFGELYQHVYTDDTQTAYEYENVDGQSVPKFTGTGSTWMWKEYGDTFQEYVTVKRNFVESDTGSWYYVNHDRAYYGYPDTWVSEESGERKTYYTKDLGEATEFTTFEYEEGVYRYAGWYEVLFDENGNEIGEADTRYDFSRIVDHNITLRLRWMKVGAFYLQYDPGEGTLNHEEENEVLYLDLDGDSYADDADVLITRVAKAPDGYEFVGWKIRSDESGTVYRAGQTFHLLSKYMATVQGKRTVFLDAVYQRVPTATIVYHANGAAVAANATIDYGSYPVTSDFDDHALEKSEDLTAEDPTITVAHIVNNSEFVLSNAAWLSMTDATFAGWCEKRTYDPDDADHPLLKVDGSEAYRVGANPGDTAEDQIVHLYAIWEVDVRYHLNQSTADANFGGDWNAPFASEGIMPFSPTGNNGTDLYSQSGVYIGSRLSWPAYDPVYTGSGALSFLGWATSASATEADYDFSQPVTGALDLYAVWGSALSCSVKVVDSSNYPSIVAASWVDGDNDGTADGDAVIPLSSAKQTPAALAADITSVAPSPYAFTFATVARKTVSMQYIQEEVIDQIYYNPQDGRIHLVYDRAQNPDVVLDEENEQLYFVYYQVKTPDIDYLLMENSGNATNITTDITSNNSAAPTSTAQLTGVTISADSAFTISSAYAPMDWLPPSVTNELNETVLKESISHYAFAIGSTDASNAVHLDHLTEAYQSGDARPDMYIRNTWRGLRFSQDGTTWYDAGTNPHLYVVFYTETPTVITLYERTVGLAADMNQPFTYDYWIEDIDPDTGDATLTYATRNPELLTDPGQIQATATQSQQLCGGETYSAILFTSAARTQRVTFVLMPDPAFAVTLPTLPAGCDTALPTWASSSVTDADRAAIYQYHDTDKPYTFSYTVTAGDPYYGGTAVIPYTNTRESVDVAFHVAQVDVFSGEINHQHDWINDSAAHSVTLSRTAAAATAFLDPSGFISPAPHYAFGAIIYGFDQYDFVSESGGDRTISLKLEPMLKDEISLAMQPMDLSETDPTLYSIYLVHADGTRVELPELSLQVASGDTDYKLYYLYYPQLTIHYVVEQADGTLTPVRGSLDGTTETDTITYSGAALTLNGVSVTQQQMVKMSREGITVSQTVGDGSFNMPPLLDNGTHPLGLIYYKLGAKPQSDYSSVSTNISDFPGNSGNGFIDPNTGEMYDSGITETMTLHAQIKNNKFAWKFQDEPDYYIIHSWPVLYAIYRERGYDLTVIKTVTTDTGYTEPYTVTVTSAAINRDKYLVSGTGYSTISAIPAQLDGGGQLVEGTGVITFEVRDGDSVTIQGLIHGSYTVTETGNENDILTAKTVVGATETEAPVTDNSTVSFTLSSNTNLVLTNTPKAICRIGERTFNTLTSAVEYIINHSSTMTETIEMLTDYLMPSSDTPVIPAYLNVTLTTANNYSGSGTVATIKRKSNVATPMISNLGTFTLGNVILDGNDVSGSAMISNEGTLNLGGDISVKNLSISTVTDQETGLETIVTTVTDGAVPATTPVIRNAAGSGNGGAVYSLKGTVNLIGGTIEHCSAKNGGAIYAANGKVNISGGTMQDNAASSGGGALYYAGSDIVTISGGTIGADGHPNTAAQGGAIYMVSGTTNMTNGSISYNTASESGGALFAHNANINVSGGELSYNAAAQNGGAVNMETLTLTISGSAAFTHNTAENGCGGAVWSGTGAVEMSGGSVSDNAAPNGSGGAVYADASEVSVIVTGTASGTPNAEVSRNLAREGGGIYANAGAITIKGTTFTSGGVTNYRTRITDNTATDGSGGGVYAASGAVTVDKASLKDNSAASGNGGALYVGFGSATLSNGYAITGNTAVNGSGVFVDTGSASFAAGSTTDNRATAGGAVGIGDLAARLYFSGDVAVKNNTLGAEISNVYLDFDSDSIINSKGLGSNSNTYVGVYVAGDMDADLFQHRGVPGAQFASYTSTNNMAKFHNDRQPALTVRNEKTAQKLYWALAVKLEIRYIQSYSAGLPTSASGDSIKTVNSYDLPGSENASSEIADALRSANTEITTKSKTAVFGAAFAVVGNTATPYADYLTDVNWDTANNCWDYIKRDGTSVSGTVSKLVVLFTEPYYLSIENNADPTLTISSLSVAGSTWSQTVINDVSQTGYGYLFAKDDVIQNELRPVAAADLTMNHDDSVKILLPGGAGLTYTLTGAFGSGSDAIDYTMTLPAGTSGSVQPDAAFTLDNGQIPTAKGGTHELVFGGSRAICRIVLDEKVAVNGTEIDVSSGEFVKLVAGTSETEGKWEYGFASLKQAADFIANHPAYFQNAAAETAATIEMLVDYMFPGGQKVNLTKAKSSITLQTSVTGTLQYPGTGADRRATISRGAQNTESFIEANDATAISGNTANITSLLTLKNLIFDGKNIGGSVDGGVVKTKNWNVTVDRCDFNNCVAENGGGLFVQVNEYSKNPLGGKLLVKDSRFTGCASTKSQDKFGGGAIWVSAKDFELVDSSFNNCTSVSQGGAVFHRVDGNFASSTTVTNCNFDGCSANAAGSMETDAQTVKITGGSIKNSIAKERNGGGINIYALNSATPSAACSIEIKGVTFENCYALKQNGGAFRSTAKTTTVEDCQFINTSGNLGGAIAISNTNADIATFKNITINQSTALSQGGGIFCQALQVIMEGDSNSIANCTAANEGGGIYHARNGASLSMTNTTLENCVSSAKNGGGVYTNANTVSMTRCAITACTTPLDGGGAYIKMAGSGDVTLTDTSISACKAGGNGGGIYTDQGTAKTLTLATGSDTDSAGCAIIGNIAGGNGGGVYTKARNLKLIEAQITENQANGNGGGVCHDSANSAGVLALSGASITGNICGYVTKESQTGIGAGIYTLTNVAMDGIVNVTGNRLRTTVEQDTAGLYMPNGMTLTLGAVGGSSTDHVFTVTGNLTVDGKPSDLRLPDKTENGETINDNKVIVLCGINGKVRVVNANKKLTQFGSASASPNPAGFTDAYKVFLADDESLYGIVDRQDPTGVKIIWGGDPICKITDGNGRLLYIDDQHVRPAVFDRLDSGDPKDTSTTSAFSTLRGSGPLYYVNGTPYTGNDFQVKMLVEEYTAEYYITATGGTERNITLTTAKTTDSMHWYRGREGTRCTILRDPRMDNQKALLTTAANLTLTNIVLDGGSENGVTAAANNRVITGNGGTNTPIQITLGRNATLQNAAITGNGGGVYLNNGARLSITGGAIRNCSAGNGGGVYIDGGAGTMTMSVGTITRCTATGDGGGVYFNKGTLTTDNSGNPAAGFIRITGGSISRCTAQNGGGVYLNAGNVVSSVSRRLYMTGGSIAGNYAEVKGGGIFVGDNNVRIYFSGAPYVYGSTSGGSVASDSACNLEMDQPFDRSAMNPGTVIVSSGLNRGTTIGVYVPGEDHQYDIGSAEENSGTLYDRHGAEMDPFATFTDENERGLNYFLNDRNGMKGGRKDSPESGDQKIYWRIIYALSVKKQVLSDDPEDMTTYRFRLTLAGAISNSEGMTTNANEISGTYGDITFTNGSATFTLSSGQTKTADLLPLGFGYTVEEILTSGQTEHFHTSVENWEGTVTPNTTQVTGEMKTSSHFNYLVTFSNLHAICKLTDEQGRLLFTYNTENSTYVPAVYSALVTAFNKVNAGNDNHWYYLGDDGNYYEDFPDSYQIQMLVPDCEAEAAASLMNGRTALLTTADRNADDGFPYVGGDTVAKIARAHNDGSMITVSNGYLTLGNITLDGNGSVYPVSANGGLIHVNSGSSLTVGTGTTLQNSTTSGSGAAVYLAQDATMNLSGAPVFSNNKATGLSLGQTPQNGGDSAFYAGNTAEQDIFITGYRNTTAASLVVTGNIDVGTIGQGSITVWAAETPHYIQNQQFAVMAGGTYSGLDAFRNARPDRVTENPLKNEEGTPTYLYGIARDGKVFWSGSMDLTISKTVTGDMANPTAAYDFTVDLDGLAGGYQCDYAIYRTDDNGTNWTQVSPAGSKLTVNNEKITFTLTNHQKIVISIPRGVTVTISEELSFGQASYTVDGGAPVSGSSTGEIAMNADTTVAFNNHFAAVAPTGFAADFPPFLLTLAFGVMLISLACYGRKRKEEE